MLLGVTRCGCVFITTLQGPISQGIFLLFKDYNLLCILNAIFTGTSLFVILY